MANIGNRGGQGLLIIAILLVLLILVIALIYREFTMTPSIHIPKERVLRPQVRPSGNS
ncbi:hypothetical protein [Vulcanisaeta distributa]|uniref:hypothetical protein n=1 Tax=Vulcanisaeta distributa TaxID=164451 RepID=UPI000ACF1808|nr:hypothetical protein [Vulcanisaeta distributa]